MSFAAENLATLRAWLAREHGAPLLGHVGYLQPADPKQAAAALDVAQLLDNLRAKQAIMQG